MNSKKVFKKALFSIVSLFAFSSLSALTVDQVEIQSAGSSEVVFRNYSGPHSVINSIAEIRAIGAGLGNQVSANPNRIGTVGDASRYAVIHAMDPTTKEKFDADIFIIGKNATVDHINNLRRIISGYLVAAYGYSEKDADTIATFVTVYNAVYRGNLDYFKSKYKDVVTKNLSPSIVGLATDYQEWPGKSQIVIPLSDLNGGLSTIDTSLISDKEVIESMQGEDDKGIDARKGMVDIKERESDNLQEKADDSQKKADEDKAKLAEEQKKKAEADAEAKKKADEAAKKKAEADKAKADADKKQAQADQAKKDAQSNPNDSNAQKNAQQAQKEADQAKKDSDSAQKQAETAQKEADSAQKQADEQAQKTDEQAQKAQESQSQADSDQAKADSKRNEAQDERESIAKDQQTLMNESQSQEENIMYGLKNVDDAGITSAIVRMDTSTGTVIKESPVSVIRGRTVYEDGDRFIAVAGSNLGNGAVRLVTIDKKSLEIAEESAEKLAETSFLAMKDGNYYCTIQEGSDFYIGKYNNRAENLNKSKVKVKAATPITITAKGVMVTDSNGVPIILDPSSLESLSPESKPNNSTVIQRTTTAASNLLDAK